MLLSLLSKRTLYDDSRDSYGFTVRPQHVHRYREYSSIYKEEEAERSEKWKEFLKQPTELTRASQSKQDNDEAVVSEVNKQSSVPGQAPNEGRDDSAEQCRAVSEFTDVKNSCGDEEKPSEKSSARNVSFKEASSSPHGKPRVVKTWADISPSLNVLDHMMSVRIEKRGNMKSRSIRCENDDLPSIDEARSSNGGSEDVDEKNNSANIPAAEAASGDRLPPVTSFPSKEELELLVRGGVPKDLRGEVWQAFVGVRTRRVERYYQDLLAVECDTIDSQEHDKSASEGKKANLSEKLKKQIEKDLPRTFPGHPALNENGRNSLRRVLSAYALHNPSVGYCQAMNFFAGLLLLMMPEENAFWTLVGIIDDYFDGYFSQEMIESQVDQLVFEDLMRERFPKLVNHLDYLGVEVAWLSGPWFLSIFVNTLPWESVLRVWDVILFEGNRVMLFRTALALMDLYGPALVTTKDAGDVITLLQTLTGSTFDSSQLVLTACVGFLAITEDRLQELRQKHRPAIVSAFDDRAKGGKSFKDPKGLATKLYSFKHDRISIGKENETEAGSDNNIEISENIDSHSASLDEFLKGMTIDSEIDSVPDLQEQVVWLKVELCRLLEEKRSEVLRNEELESALMELVQEANRMELAAKVELLEKELAELRQVLADKQAGESAMLEVLMKVEQEQRIAEEARRLAEQEAATHKQALQVLQEKYDKVVADMELRVVMAESVLEATLEYETGQSKASSSPKSGNLDLPENQAKKSSILSFGLGWRDRSKGNAGSDDTSNVDDESQSNVADESHETDGLLE